MTRSDSGTLNARCSCGQVQMRAVGKPIVATACYCASCRKAGALLEALPGAAPVLNSDGSTDFVLFRKDRINCVRGAERLREHRLTPTSKTRRVVATCCNAPMFLEFTSGHWLTLYRQRLDEDARPPLEMRVMTRDRRADVSVMDDVPNYAGHSGKFMLKLIGAWAAMAFRSPEVDYVKGELDGHGT
ncbi:GFA family protein [Ensifer sp. 4252]|uniref:GFA family protein n=1 Tax=Ensifer sp. 4252 TaxID=3373915 RepID=UPI003D1C9E31